MPNEMCSTCKLRKDNGCSAGLDTPPDKPCLGYEMDFDKFVESHNEWKRDFDAILEKI